ncbi:hypothetical protein KY149_004699 [Escherichia coli]|nr:hypothetical protein [Escherichia coli]
MKNFSRAVLAIALMGSSVSIFAAPGETIGSGSGSVTISGNLTTSTCSLAVTGNNQTFNLTHDQIKSASDGEELTRQTAGFSLNNCAKTPLLVTVTAQASEGDPLYNQFNEGDNIGIRYQLVGENMNDGRWTWNNSNSQVGNASAVFKNNGDADAMVFTPVSDSDTFNIHTRVVRHAKGGEQLQNTVSATYNYNIKYK